MSKINKNTIPENFTLGLAAVDAVPVVFFGLNALVVGKLFSNALFLTGAVICLVSGVLKVLWKVIVAAARKNIWPLFIQMRILMPMGFLMMLLTLLFNSGRIDLYAVWKAVSSMPSALFFLLGIIGMILMSLFAVKLDSSDLRSNWIEQITNGIAQICFFAGLILL